jgi:hypothetical protein
MTSLYAAHSVCSVYLANKIALSIDAPIYLHAGSHLGAILHGGPIPWDDDVDMYLPHRGGGRHPILSYDPIIIIK